MTNFIPIFPLNIVVYPDELMKLHIFEPRYKQLIKVCLDQQKPFGIPCVMDRELKKHGTLMDVISLDKAYGNGEMDIQVKGGSVFKILKVIQEVPDKLFSGAIVHYPDNITDGSSWMMKNIVRGIRSMHELLQLDLHFKKPVEALLSYDVAHKAGLSTLQEYEILCIFREIQRQEYLRRHLKKMIPFLAGLKQVKDRALLNGVYRGFSTDDF